MSEPVIGIDLGTTNSVVACIHGGHPTVIRNRVGSILTPSVVAVSKTGKRLVGQMAKRQAVTNPQDTIYAVKRLIGRRYSSEIVQAAIQSLPYEVASGEHDDIRFRLGPKFVSGPEVSAMVLAELKADAEAFFGRSVSKAVITVPAYFNDGQRQATKDAGMIAGLDVLRILNEPTAAALAYGFGRNMNGTVAVFDMGGGTFDISVLDISDGVFDVRAVGGDTYLGGEDFDNRIIDWLVVGFRKEHGVDLRQDRMALQRLKDAAEKAKIELSEVRETQINLPFISTPEGGGAALHLSCVLTRERFEALCKDLIDKTLAHCEQVLAEANVAPGDLREMILVGGMTRMPRLVDAVREYFQREPCQSVHPEEVVSMGAAVQAHALTADESRVVLLDVTPQSLGVAIAGGYVRTLIPKNTTVPTATTEMFNTSKDFQTQVKIMVLQEESSLAHQNELLGEFTLTGLREALRGEVEVEVTFDINSEGIVSVSARDKETNKEQSLVVTASAGLTEEELQKILKENSDQLLSTKDSNLVVELRAELAGMVHEMASLLPRAYEATSGSDLGGDAVAKAALSLETARRAIDTKDPRTMRESADSLVRSLEVIKGVIDNLVK